MFHFRLPPVVLALSALAIPWTGTALAAPPVTPIPSPAEIEKIAAALPPQPQGVGRPITDRAAWMAAAQHPTFQKALKEAAAFATQPIPELPETLYREILKTGLRPPYETPARLRTTRLCAFVVAECIEDRGTYLPLIEKEIDAILGEYSWAAPAHGLFVKPTVGPEREVDLAAAARAWTLGTADYWLGDKLKPETRARIRTETARRVFDYYTEAVKTGHPRWWWTTVDTNWNAVCNAGVMGAALALLPSREERALYIAGVENYLPYYLSGFPDDGYDNEGMSYWAYGFGNYLCLAETAYEATHGTVNLFQNPKLRQIAQFPRRFEIMDGILPAFGDSGVAKIKGWEKVLPVALFDLINKRWGMGWKDFDPKKGDLFTTHPLGDRLNAFGLFGFPLPVYGGSPVAGSPTVQDSDAFTPLRSFFKSSSVLITRSERAGAPRLGLALKGGDNGHAHSHYDNGTYVVVCNGEALLVDTGMAVYTADVEGLRWADCMMNNSYGHGVPYIAKTLQHGGKEALGKVVKTEFTDDQDKLTMDLSSSYTVPGLKKLVRTYVLDRKRPAIEITDEAEFSQPTAFGGALITFSDYKEESPGTFLIFNKAAALRATVTVDGGTFVDKPEPFSGTRVQPRLGATRIGIDLAEPSTHVVMHTLIVPAKTSEAPPVSDHSPTPAR